MSEFAPRFDMLARADLIYQKRQKRWRLKIDTCDDEPVEVYHFTDLGAACFEVDMLMEQAYVQMTEELFYNLSQGRVGGFGYLGKGD